MGTNKGKKGRRETKPTSTKAIEGSKIPGLPPAKPLKKPKKVPSQKKKNAKSNSSGPATYDIPMGHPKPFTKSPQYAKWPALFRKHLGVIEAHIRTLDRVMQSMKNEMAQMEEKERIEWELGERGNWRVVCEMMDRAREVQASARKAAQGILPVRILKEKKVETPGSQPKAADLGHDSKGKEKVGRDPDAADSDHNTTSSSDSDSDSDSSNSSSLEEEESEEAGSVTGGDDFVSFKAGANAPRLNKDLDEETTNGVVEPNPFFVIDTEPTPVNLSSISSHGQTKTETRPKETKKEKKERLAAEREVKKAARKAIGEQRKREQQERERAAAEAAAKITAAVTEAPEAEATNPEAAEEIDFFALEAKLQAEIAAGTKAKSEVEMKRKRRRSSGGADEVETKKVKKAAPEENMVKKEKKRKVEEEAEVEERSDAAVEKKKLKEKKVKSEGGEEKTAKKQKKRKADSDESLDEAKKKKRKLKNDEA